MDCFTKAIFNLCLAILTSQIPKAIESKANVDDYDRSDSSCFSLSQPKGICMGFKLCC